MLRHERLKSQHMKMDLDLVFHLSSGKHGKPLVLMFHLVLVLPQVLVPLVVLDKELAKSSDR